MTPPRREDESGAIAVLVAVFALVMFGFAALVVDLGAARDARRMSQNASDASALAAANAMYPSGSQVADVPAAVTAAMSYASANHGVTATDWSTCTDGEAFMVPSGSTPCISFRPNLTRPEEVRVRMPVELVKTPFAGALGIKSTDVAIASFAQAKMNVGGRSKCAFCVLGSGFLHDIQNGNVTVAGGDIHFNGNVSVSNNGIVATDGQTTVEGYASGSLADYDPDPITGAAPISDPLAAVDFSTITAGLSPRSNPCVAGPGIYGSLSVRNEVCTLQPGTYVIAGGSGTTWDLAGNSSTQLRGTGVTLYFTCGSSTTPRACNSGETGATLDSSGNGSVVLSAPTSGTWKGYAVVYDRNNTATFRMTGNGSSTTVGTIYLTSGKLRLDGNGCAAAYDALVIVRDVETNGNPACLDTVYNSDNNAQVPPGALHLSR